MKNIVVVGGSSGIGEAILKQNIANHNCINISRSEPSISSPNLRHYSADILTDTLPDLDNIDALVYCPGSINLKPISSLKETDFENDFKINVLGAVRVIKHYLKALKTGDVPSSIVLFSTVAVKQGMPFHSSVAVSKAGSEALAKSLAAELAPRVRVNCIAPTITDTPLASSILRNDKSRANLAERHPMKRILEADDVASMASYLISDSASAITGQIIGVDAGMSTLKI